jgi:hypothetical protein
LNIGECEVKKEVTGLELWFMRERVVLVIRYGGNNKEQQEEKRTDKQNNHKTPNTKH